MGTVLMVMLMLNMSLAIVMDVYGQSKTDAGVSDSLWEQIYESTHQMKNKAFISNQSLLEIAERLPKEMVSKSTLMEACPELSAQQADMLIDKIDEREEYDLSQSTSLADG